MNMLLSDFKYELDESLIAQYPSANRGQDRLLFLDRNTGAYKDMVFDDILSFFKKEDVLVLNDTRVIPARLLGRRKTGAQVEIFIIDKTKFPVEALIRNSSKVKDNETILIESGDEVIVKEKTSMGRLVEFKDDVDEVLQRAGHVPLPPYINRPDEEADRIRYQTVFAGKDGATASPTAGLHFTRGHLEKLKAKGVFIVYITLHVSYGTFAPVKTKMINQHKMHSEYYFISKENITVLNESRNKKRRIIPCGTTAMRTLETCADDLINYLPQAYSYGGQQFKGFEGFTDLFIYPGYKFRIADGLITNFHLPESSLLMLVSAFAGRENVLRGYKHAVKQKYRFFSYGDAMLIL